MSTESQAHAVSGEPEWLSLVREQVRGLRYGVVQLVVHNGKVIQIERTERTRLASDRPARGGEAPQ